jgi:eukaryotic-like serine/threonine-protein kinase
MKELIGREIGGWQLFELLGEGNSAAVFSGSRGSDVAAVKVFKKSLVEEFGKAEQLQRIERELTLRGHDHPNLIKILDGGECQVTGFLYVVMELVEAPNLASVIGAIPRERIRSIVAQVADAAHYLESKGIVHRDIKPDNIAISKDFSKATLLDLGVIRPVDVSKLTDPSDDKRESFLGTMRYSPPEYLFRTEKDTEEGYRAITFYQLGGVLYDLIMRERLFDAFSRPKARLVKAVEVEVPRIEQSDVARDLILLARNCLLKKAHLRVQFVKWEHFEEAKIEPATEARLRVMRRFAASLDSVELERPSTEPSAWEVQRAIKDVQQKLTAAVKASCVTKKMFPRSTTTEMPNFEDRSASVLIVFEAAPSLEITTALAVLVTATLVDVTPASVTVTVRAFRSYDGSQGHLTDLRRCDENQVFEGVLEEVTMSTMFEDMLFRIIDATQSALNEPPCIKI